MVLLSFYVAKEIKVLLIEIYSAQFLSLMLCKTYKQLQSSIIIISQIYTFYLI